MNGLRATAGRNDEEMIIRVGAVIGTYIHANGKLAMSLSKST